MQIYKITLYAQKHYHGTMKSSGVEKASDKLGGEDKMSNTQKIFQHHNAEKYQYHYTNKHNHKPANLLDLYHNKFVSTLHHKYATSSVALDPNHDIPLSNGCISNGLGSGSAAASLIPVIGSIIGGIANIASFIASAAHQHKIEVKAENLTSFVEDPKTKFEEFIQDLATQTTSKHANYIKTLDGHKESIKWINKGPIEKLKAKLDNDHTKAEKLVTDLAIAHAKMIIKVIQKGLEHDHCEQDKNMLTQAIEDTFGDEHILPPHVIKAVFLSGFDNSYNDSSEA